MMWPSQLLLLALYMHSALAFNFLRNSNRLQPDPGISSSLAKEDVCNMTLKNLYPLWSDTLYSCQGRCGAVRSVPCSCDELCRVLGDCCLDFSDRCPSEAMPTLAQPMSPTTDTNVNDSNAHMGNDTGKRRGTPPFAECTRMNTRLIASCPRGFAQSDSQAAVIEAKCRLDDVYDMASIRSLMPVTDRTTGYHFKNVYCHRCNGGRAEDGLEWSLKIRSGLEDAFPFNTLEGIFTMMRKNSTSLHAVPPDGITRRICIPNSVWEDYSPPCLCPNLQQLCDSQDGYVLGSRGLFRNEHCLVCYLATTGLDLEYLEIPTEYLIELVRNPVGFDILMKWTAVQQSPGTEGLETQELTTSLGGFVEMQADGYLPWARMVCENTPDITANAQDKTVTEDTVMNQSLESIQDYDSSVTQPPHAENATQVTGIGFSEMTSTLTAGEDASADTGTDPWINRETVRLETTSQLPGASEDAMNKVFCSQLECRKKLYYLDGQCIGHVFGVRLVVSYAKDERLAIRLQSSVELIQEPKRQVEMGLLESKENFHPDLSLVFLQVTHNQTTMSVEVYADIRFIRGTEEWGQRWRLLSKQVSRQIVDVVLNTLVNTYGAEARALDVCAMSYLGKMSEDEFQDKRNCMIYKLGVTVGCPTNGAYGPGYHPLLPWVCVLFCLSRALYVSISLVTKSSCSF